MRKLLKKIPRWVKILWNILLLFCLAVLIYTFLGAPVSSLEAQFRRTEQAHMVGPGRILGTVGLELDMGSYRQMLVAETEEGVILYSFDHPMYDPPVLTYRPKTGDMTLLSAPYPKDSREKQTVSDLPLLLFDGCPEAASATMDLTLEITYRGETFREVYSMKAKREFESFFLFHINTRNPYGLRLEGTALQRVTLLGGYHSGGYYNMVIPAEVKLYGENGDLLETRTVELTSIPHMTQQQREGTGT